MLPSDITTRRLTFRQRVGLFRDVVRFAWFKVPLIRWTLWVATGRNV